MLVSDVHKGKGATIVVLDDEDRVLASHTLRVGG